MMLMATYFTDTMGIFTYLNSTDLSPGNNTMKADYNPDRVVFYSPKDATKMIGFVSNFKLVILSEHLTQADHAHSLSSFVSTIVFDCMAEQLLT